MLPKPGGAGWKWHFTKSYRHFWANGRGGEVHERCQSDDLVVEGTVGGCIHFGEDPLHVADAIRVRDDVECYRDGGVDKDPLQGGHVSTRGKEKERKKCQSILFWRETILTGYVCTYVCMYVCMEVALYGVAHHYGRSNRAKGSGPSGSWVHCLNPALLTLNHTHALDMCFLRQLNSRQLGVTCTLMYRGAESHRAVWLSMVSADRSRWISKHFIYFT